MTDPINNIFKWTADCSAKWNGLLLRTEETDDNLWSWSVYDMEQNEFEIDTSNNHDDLIQSDEAARKKAEECALAYQKEKLKNSGVGEFNITKRFFYVSMIALAFLVIKLLFIDTLIIGNPCDHHTHQASDLFNFFYPSTAAEGFHPEPSTLNHALTFLIGCLIGWGILRIANRQKK